TSVFVPPVSTAIIIGCIIACLPVLQLSRICSIIKIPNKVSGVKSMKSTVRQGGSVKVFIIVGVILALVALGVLYGVNRFATNDQTPPLEVPERSDAVDEEAGEQSPGASNDTND